MSRYAARVSGPLMDRLDLQVEVPALAFAEISSDLPGEATAAVRERVIAARRRQMARWRCLNARLPAPRLRGSIRLTPGAQRMLAHAVDRMGVSGRGHDRVLQVAVTLRDLACTGSPDARNAVVELNERHVAEALSYRALERRERMRTPWGGRATSGAGALP